MKKSTIYQSFKRAFAKFKNAVTLYVLMLSGLFFSLQGFAQPWTYDFGTGTGSFNTASGTSTTFFSSNTAATPSGGGTYFIRASAANGGNNPGAGFTLANPGTALGTGTELQINGSASGSTNKFTVYGWNNPSNTAYLKVKLRSTSGGNGIYAINLGDGLAVTYQDANDYSNYVHSIASVQITYASGAISTLVVRTNGSNTTVSSSGIAKDANQIIEIYANNNINSVTYIKSGTNTLGAGCWDLWVDGTKLSPSGGYITAGTLGTNVTLNGIGLFAQNSTSNAMTLYLDDLEYSNSLPSQAYLDDYDFDSRASGNWGTNSTWIKKLSGSVTFAASTAVIGTNTAFTRELANGDVLMLQGSTGTVRGTVASITDDTHLTLLANATAGSGTYGKQASPTSANGAIAILNGHTVTVAASVTTDQVSCNSGSALTISSGATLTIANGTGTDFTEANTAITVNGTLTINQNATASGGGGNGNNNGSITVTSGGVINVNGSLTGVSSVAWVVTINSGGLMTIDGTGTVSLQRSNNGILIQIAGNAYLTAGGTMASTGSGTTNVASGGVLEIEPNAFVNGNDFTLSSGGTLKIGSPDGITANACGTGATCGNIRSTSRTFATDAHYEYKGVAAQVTGSGFPSLAMTGNLTITNTVGVTPSAVAATTVNTPGSVIVNGYLTPTLAQTVAGTGTLTGTGTVRITETTNAVNNFITQYPITNKTLTNLTLEFKGGAAQKFNTTTALGGLKMDNSAGLTLGANANVNGTLDLTSGLITTGANTISVGAASTAGSVVNASSSSYVNGILARAYLATGSKTFDIGKGGNYRQLAFQYVSLTGTPSFVSMEQFESGFPGTAPAGHVQLGTRYWHVTQSGASAYLYKITLDPAGLTPTNAVVILKYDNLNTVALATTTPNYTNSVSQSALSDFALGEVTCVAAPSQPDPFTTSSAAICAGQNGVVYTVPNDPAATGYSWSYTGGTGATIIGTSNSVTVDFSALATSGTLEVTADNPCGQSTPRTIGITVNSASQPDPFIAASPNVCPGLTGVLYTVPNDPTVTYNWNYTGTGVTINGTGNSVTLDFSGSATSGTLEVTATSTFGCGTSAARTIAITVEIPATISCIGNVTQGNNSPSCNAVVTYGAPTVGGTSPTITYLFSGATSGSGSGDASGSTFNVGVTTVILTASNTCASPSCSFDVEVTKTSPTAPTSITSDDLDNEICLGQSIAFTANGSTAGSAGGVVYWYEGGCGSGTPLGTGPTLTLDGQGGNPPVPTAGPHTYYARVEDNCLENTTCASLSIAVSAGPPPNAITAVNSPNSACSGDQALVTATTSGGPGVSYSWFQGSGSNTVLFSETVGGPFTAGPIVTTLPQVYVEFGTPAGWSGYYVCAQATNGCGSTTDTCHWTRGVVNGPGTITPATQVVACPNDVKIYSCGPSNGASVYIWTLNGSQAPISPNGGNNPTNVSVTFPSNFTSGQLCVTAALSCMGSSTSAPRCITINKNPSGPGTITGPATLCSGATNVSYSVPSVPGASGYNWTVPANATITSGVNTPAITVDFPTSYTGTGSVCVTATSPCGASGTKCKSVVSGVPNTPAGITGPLTNICNSTVQYSVVNPVVSSYTWTNPAGTTIASGQGNSTIQLSVSPAFTSGYLTVVANSSLCTGVSSAPKLSSTFWGKPNTPGTITQSPPGPFCSGDNLNFSVVNQTPGPIPVYTWTSSNGAITAGQGTNNISVTWGTNAPGTIRVRASNGCGISAGTRSQVFNTNNCREEGTHTTSVTAFSIYPNPAHDNLTVSIEANEHADFSLQLTDVSGRAVLAESRTGLAGLNIYELDISNLSKGVYMLEVKSVNDNWRTKVVVE